MAKYTPQEVLDHYNDLSGRERAEFKRLVKAQEGFKRGLDKLADVINEHGPDAVKLAFLGRTAEARAASAAYRQAQPPKPQLENKENPFVQ